MATQVATTDEQQRNIVSLTPEAEKFSLMQRQAQLFAASPLIPAHLRQGTPQQAMANCYIAMTIADRMGEDRMTVMQNIHIVHGTAGFKAQYMIARANASGKFKGTIDWEISGAGKDLSVTAFATLAATGRRVEITVDMKMAEAEGWTKNSKYKTMPEIMLRYRSATFLVRMYAPEVMLGYQTSDEVEDMGYAAMPAAEPLTGQALLEQAREESPAAADGSGEEPGQQGGDAAGAAPTDADEQPGRADSDMGEVVTLAEAIDQINAQTTAADVMRLHDSLVLGFDDADQTKLQDAVDLRCEALRKAEPAQGSTFDRMAALAGEG